MAKSKQLACLILWIFLSSATLPVAIEATDFSNDGGESCSIGSGSSCIKGSVIGSTVTPRVGGLDDSDAFTMTTGTFTGRTSILNLVLNNTAVSINNGATHDFAFTDQASATINAKNSALVFNNISFTGGSTPMNAIGVTFDGAYKGEGDPSAKGYAMVGNTITTMWGTPTFNFTNNANVKLRTGIRATHNQVQTATYNFTDSSLEGSIATEDSISGNNKSAKVTVNFTNNSEKEYALKGNVFSRLGTATVTFDNAKMIGSLYTSPNGTSDGSFSDNNARPLPLQITLHYKEISTLEILIFPRGLIMD